MLETGSDIRTVQELLGPKDVRTTLPSPDRTGTHVLNRPGLAVQSLLDRLGACS
ncbi:MAG: hypothetical protein DWQ34_06710 [Planctomycetota bacterium]|nr:MAG: hypothetical protein DWQ29_23750 [Planctomycetota bacterium]REJ95213.1 MAG: hypothetical protein DWQ34_06710 [Planctomycetota bacterium]REK25058.1 MAG: hypothetical protein DWQ41_12860 [Planctomycetota bacterium]REK28123.1 MAG: hypothetical protein DWQ45_25185 [Planctomycetota bacterium]